MTEDAFFENEPRDYHDETENYSQNFLTEEERKKRFEILERNISTKQVKLNRELFVEKRVFEFINNMGLGLDSSKTSIIQCNLSNRLRYYIHEKNCKQFCLNIGELQWIDKRYVDAEIMRNNCITQLDDNVFFLNYYESYVANYCNYNFFGLIFNNTRSFQWNEQKQAQWIIKFSDELRSLDLKFQKKTRNLKAFEGLFLPESLFEEIKSEIDDFLSCREQYVNDLKMSWKRGYMFVGGPGNGKTSLIRCICDYWGLEHKEFKEAINRDGSIDLRSATSSNFLDQIISPSDTKPTVLILEDIDKYVTFQSEGEHSDSASVSLHELLKGLDGVDQVSGVMLIATTNCACEISEALVNRPGRVDKIWEIKKPLPEHIKGLIDYYKINIQDNKIEEVINQLKTYSMAFVAEFIKACKTKYRKNDMSMEEANEILKGIHRHNKMYKNKFKPEKKVVPFGLIRSED